MRRRVVPLLPRRGVAAAAVAAMLFTSLPAYAEGEKESLEMLQETTLNLIDLLVEQGVLSRDKADTLIKAARAKAAAKVAAQPEAEKTAPGRIRVPYVPEVVKNEMREQIKQEVLAQAKSESWGNPGALPDWISRIKWEGDIRLRSQTEMMASDNSPADDYVTANLISLTTRAPDLGNQRGFASISNTEGDRERMRLRARLGMQAKISEDFSGGVRLTTGNTTDRVSTNQSLGQNFNKYSLVLDRAFLRYQPNDWLTVTGGRIPNPWFSTDLVWDEDLNFEGVAVNFERKSSAQSLAPYLTLGVFPIREDNPPTRNNRWLGGAQTGFQWGVNRQTRFKLGVAYYGYRNIEGRKESDDDYIGSTQFDPAYGQYEYEAGLRQKGNTLFYTNSDLQTDVTDPSKVLWGLASRFREVNVTGSLDLGQWDPVHAILIADYVKNVGYDRQEILDRARLVEADMPDGDSKAYLLKLQLGWPEVKNRNEWNAFVAYRYVGSDAVLDAFTDSDFGLGGTNLKGYQLGFNYGIDTNVSLGLKWMSADSIDSMIPASPSLGLSSTKTSFGVDLLQIDVSARF